MNLSNPPPNYVPGIGRGAIGFTTRSDIGPANPNPNRIPDDEDEHIHENRSFEGTEIGFSASMEYDEDDEKADAIYAKVDKDMESRRKTKRKPEKSVNPRGHVSDNFGDLKGKLLEVTESEWDGIPEIGNYSRSNHNKKRRFERFSYTPDSLYEKAMQEKELVNAVEVKSVGGTETDLTAVGEGRGMMLALKLDRMSDSVTGTTNVDPKGYLTDLKCMNMTNMSDVKKARLLLRSLTKTDPKNPLGWIAAARLEEEMGDVRAARKFIEKGCEECPKSEDVWLRACHLAIPDEAKGVIAKGVQAIPRSVKLWMQAADLEKDPVNKSRVLRKALDSVVDSVKLWKAVVDLANDEDARVLLYRAVECCPLNVDLWLALGRLESYDKAMKVLNRAKKTLPKERAVWIAAAKLEEANGKIDNVKRIIDRGIQSLQLDGLEINREAWMKDAEDAERAGLVVTCQAIIHTTVGFGVDDVDRKKTWIADAEECESRGSYETARAIFSHALTLLVTKKSVWIKAAELEKRHGNREAFDSLLRRAVTYLPQNEDLWLMGAKAKWLSGDVPAARAILQEAYTAIPNSEKILLAAFKLEFENHETERARMLVAKARERGGTGRVWMKSAIVEREVGNVAEERRFLEEGLKQYPSFFKLWLMLGQLEDRHNLMDKAKAAYQSGLEHCPDCIPMWVELASLEEKVNGLIKARAVLTMARKKNPKNPELWLAAVKAESRHGNKKHADTLMAIALQECPVSGILWATSIEMVPYPQRKGKSNVAYTNCKDDPYVISAIAKLFWQNRKLEKARKWLNTSVTLAPDIGDFWALYYKFELQHGDDEKQKDVLKRCISAEPKHGERWQKISKALENSHQTIEEVLKKTVSALAKEENVL
ncbi:Protein STABILIZED1 [Ranunculus cassubicifolius]